MYEKAQVYFEGMRQIVKLPEGYLLDWKEVYVRRDKISGDLILSRRPMSWEEFFAEDVRGDVPEDFMSPEERAQVVHDRDPFADDGK